MNPENGLLLNDKSEKDTQLLLQQIQESTMCIGQRHFYEVDYALIYQVRQISILLFA